MSFSKEAVILQDCQATAPPLVWFLRSHPSLMARLVLWEGRKNNNKLNHDYKKLYRHNQSQPTTQSISKQIYFNGIKSGKICLIMLQFYWRPCSINYVVLFGSLFVLFAQIHQMFCMQSSGNVPLFQLLLNNPFVIKTHHYGETSVLNTKWSTKQRIKHQGKVSWRNWKPHLKTSGGSVSGLKQQKAI